MDSSTDTPDPPILASDERTEPRITSEPPAALAGMDAKLDSFIEPIINVVTRGICACIVGVPLPFILTAISRSMGKIIGTALSVGDLGPVLRARSNCKNAFDAGVNATVPQPAPKPDAQPQESMKDLLARLKAQSGG